MPTDRAPLPRSSRPRTIRPKRTYGVRLAPTSTRRHHLQGHRVVGVVLLIVAAALVPTHLAEHAGVIDPLPGKLEDLFLGFPMAGLLGVAALIAFIWRE